MVNKKLFNLDTSDDHKVDDDYNTRIRDRKSELYYDGLYDDNTLVSKVYVDTVAVTKTYVDSENSEQDIAIADKTNKSYVDKVGSDLQADINRTKSALGEVSVKLDQGLDEKLSIHGGNSMTVDLDMGYNKIKKIAPGSSDNDAVNYQQFTTKTNENETLLLDGSNKMLVDLDMNNNKITNLSTDANNVLSATNVGYINQVKGDMITKLTDSFNKKISESHISGSTNKKMFSNTLWMMLINQQVKITLSLMVSKTFLIHLMISVKKVTVSEWEKEHKTGMHLHWFPTCTNFLRVNSLW